ncbi:MULTISPECIES: hypothetical protein [Serratia]|jgi:MFS-type transporter involved in bile tolerance (Atg22 family)|uniref:hypothetical protein n=1 Tax=Serratia TaxID=613 RepID=UPI000A73BC7A|nr:MULTISPECIES: hypothetical protein [Serratia]MBH2564563.1 hypothetical protein [Serratia marcescens]MDH2269649.1 hypothetical protein [Serratia marcescens]MDH2277626.1 hypothetical protein [Serratia marcescens]QKO39062.1 hypothetical protein F0335_11190 [Serratia marcescens]HEJ7915911.1 hypothetical protein [Serratia marcescens]
MKKSFIVLFAILIGLVVGTTADYFSLNRFLKYALIAFAVIATHKLLNSDRGQRSA